MDYSLLNGIGSYLMFGENNGISSYLTNPYLSGVYSSGLTSQAGISNVFQSGVRFGQALEKAKANNPESAEELQKILDEAFGSRSSEKTDSAGKSTKTTKNTKNTKSSAAVVYEPSWKSTERSSGGLESYLAARRASRVQQRQAARQH